MKKSGIWLLCGLLSLLLLENNGTVEVRSARTGETLAVTEIRTEGLRRTDREALRDGIPAADREALLKLLEDLNS